jgi:hypothetical protein
LTTAIAYIGFPQKSSAIAFMEIRTVIKAFLVGSRAAFLLLQAFGYFIVRPFLDRPRVLVVD